jgi:hypothetical protein
MSTGLAIYLSRAASRVTVSNLASVGSAAVQPEHFRLGLGAYSQPPWLTFTGWSGAGEVAVAEERGSCQGGEDSQAGEPCGGGPVGLGGGGGLDVVED